MSAYTKWYFVAILFHLAHWVLGLSFYDIYHSYFLTAAESFSEWYITFYLTAYQLINIWVVYISFCYYEQECTMWIIMYNHVRLFINKYFYSRGVYLHEISRSCNNTTFRFWRNCQSYVCSKYTASFYIPFNNVHEWMSPNLMNSYFRKCHTPSLKGKRKEV